MDHKNKRLYRLYMLNMATIVCESHSIILCIYIYDNNDIYINIYDMF